MDTNRATRALELTAKNHGISLEEVIMEIEAVIEEAMNSQDPNVLKLWASIPCVGERLTPAELLTWIAEKHKTLPSYDSSVLKSLICRGIPW